MDPNGLRMWVEVITKIEMEGALEANTAPIFLEAETEVDMAKIVTLQIMYS